MSAIPWYTFKTCDPVVIGWASAWKTVAENISTRSDVDSAPNLNAIWIVIVDIGLLTINSCSVVSQFCGHYCICCCLYRSGIIRLRNDLYCVEWGVKLYSLTHRSGIDMRKIVCSFTSDTALNDVYMHWCVEYESENAFQTHKRFFYSTYIQ